MEAPARVELVNQPKASDPDFLNSEALKNLGLHEVFQQMKEPIFQGLDANHDGIKSCFYGGFVHIFYSNLALKKVGLNHISEGLHVI
jgi:hypothetical protein